MVIASALAWFNGYPLLIAAILFIESALIGYGVGFLRSQFFGPAVYSLADSLADSNKVALTFDDGPTHSTTPKVLALLAQYNIKATFFIIADKAVEHPEVVKAIIAQGHCIGSHDLHHSNTENLRFYTKAKDEIEQSCAVLQNISGQKITLYRPPVGLYNPHIAKAVATLGLTTVGWSATIRDNCNRNIAHIKKIPTLAKAKDTSILIFHDSAPNSVNEALFLEKLEELIVALKEQGKEFVSLEDL